MKLKKENKNKKQLHILNKNKKQLHILNKNHHTTKIITLSILLKLEEKKRSYVLLNFGKNFNM